jgi:tetratricopeptide (TPR) repeat protein
MKKINWGLLLFITTLLFSCESSTKETSGGKVTEITATSSVKEAQAAFTSGLSLLDLGEFQKARESFNKAIELDPKFGWAYLLRANTSQSAKEFADDVNNGKANSDSADEWQKMYADYQMTNLSANRDKGIEILEKIAAAYPDAARAHVDLGNGYSGNNQFDKARASFQKAIELAPKWVGGYSFLANSYLFNEPKDLKKAEENALKVVELAPSSAGAQITLGDCYRAQNDFQKAKDAYAKAVQLAPDASEAYYKEGHANTYLGNLDEARKNYEDGGKHDVSILPSLLNISYTYLYAGDTKAALSTLMGAVSKLDSSKSARYASEKNACLNTAAFIANHTEDGATLKQLVPKLLPLSVQINNDLGTPEAKAFIKVDSLNWMADIALLDGKIAEAKTLAEEMKTALNDIKDGRKLEGYHFLMGKIAMKEKNYADAITHFGQADKNAIYTTYMLAKANEGAGNADKATELYKEVAAYNFNGVDNASVRAEVKKKLGMP